MKLETLQEVLKLQVDKQSEKLTFMMESAPFKNEEGETRIRIGTKSFSNDVNLAELAEAMFDVEFKRMEGDVPVFGPISECVA